MRVRLASEVPLDNDNSIPAGTEGEVIDTDTELGTVDVKLDQHFPHIGNRLTVWFPYTSDIVLEFITPLLSFFVVARLGSLKAFHADWLIGTIWSRLHM